MFFVRYSYKNTYTELTAFNERLHEHQQKLQLLQKLHHATSQRSLSPRTENATLLCLT